MNDEAVYRTAPETPGLLNINVYKLICLQVYSSKYTASEIHVALNDIVFTK